MLKFKRSAAAMPAQDVERARAFYERTLGLKPVEEMSDGGALYRVGETGFGVFASMGQASGTHTQMAFEVDDVAETASELKRLGVRLEEYDFGDYKTLDGVMRLPDGTRSAWFKDTEGNLIAVRERAGRPGA